MRPLGHRRQVLLFLGAMFVPCCVLVVLSISILRQERELAERRRDSERRRAIEQLRAELQLHLDRIRVEEFRDASEPGWPHPGRYRNPAVALLARIEENRLVLPWERDEGARVQELIGHGEFARLIRQGEQQELTGAVSESARSFRRAFSAARGSTQASYARLQYARVAAKLGRVQEALDGYRRLLDTPVDVVDEDGVPLNLRAAEGLLEAGAAPEQALAVVLAAGGKEMMLSTVACYALTGMLEKLGPAAAGIAVQVRAQRRLMEQADSLRREFPRMKLKPDRWRPYGEDLWLVSSAPPGGPPAIICARARDVFSAIASAWNSRGWARVEFATEGAGELLGDAFPGVKAALALSGEADLLRRERLRRLVWFFAVVLLVAATMFGAWLLWRDLRRDVRVAELRSQFVSSVSHELKTPLTAIRMFAETLQLRQPDERTRSEYLETIVSECERLTRLVEDILAFSKIEQRLKTYHLRPIGLDYVVRSAVRALDYPMEQQGFELKVAMAEGLPRVRADADALEQAVLNLLSNAMKYSGESRTIELDLGRDNGQAIISVTDHGVGIAAADQPRIFEKYYRAPTRENQLIPGAGLGLALVSHIVKAHGGRVEVRSTPGKGSTFSIRIPLEEQS